MTTQAPPGPGRGELQGIGVSAGTAVGPVVRLVPAPRPPADEPPPGDVPTAAAQVRAALEEVALDLEARSGKADPTASAILTATAMMARDPGLAATAERHLSAGKGPAHAVDAAVEEVCATFSAAGGYLAERVTDLRDVRDRAVSRILGLPDPGVPPLHEPSVLVARDLAPAETAGLSPDLVLAIVTEEGGPTSHTAILAAQLGIPAVVKTASATTLAEGTVVAVDGGSGRVVLDPDETLRSAFGEAARRRARLLSASTGPGVTRDGAPVALLANVGTLDDARRAAAQDLEGVGLFRTEFLFLDRTDAPSLAEQVRVYAGVLEAFGSRRVVVRTLDAGADKPLAFADLGAEENPALGVRGLRLSQRREDLLATQLDALASAARATGADVRVMAPMVATVDEARWFADQVRSRGLPTVGVMVEVPAAALRSRHLLAEVDFASLGTNDLAQYAMAADRLQGDLAPLLDPWQPALLDLVAAACEGGEATGRPVGVCGEAAGDPVLALVLVGLGVTSLSMAPSKVPAVRHSLARHDLATCRRLAEQARSAPGAAEARESVRAAVDPEVLALT